MLARLRLFIRGIVRRSHTDREIDDEMRFHLESSAALLQARGMSRDAAWRQAVQQFGNVTLTKEESREQHRIRFVDDVWADTRYAGRVLRRSPAFAIVATATIALG